MTRRSIERGGDVPGGDRPGSTLDGGRAVPDRQDVSLRLDDDRAPLRQKRPDDGHGVFGGVVSEREDPDDDLRGRHRGRARGSEEEGEDEERGAGHDQRSAPGFATKTTVGSVGVEAAN